MNINFNLRFGFWFNFSKHTLGRFSKYAGQPAWGLNTSITLGRRYFSFGGNFKDWNFKFDSHEVYD